MIENFTKGRERLEVRWNVTFSDVVFELLQRRVLTGSIIDFLNGDGLDVGAKV